MLRRSPPIFTGSTSSGRAGPEARRGRRWGRSLALREEVVEVAVDDTAVGAGAGHGGEIDAERPRPLAHGRCRQWPRSGPLRTWCGDPVDRCDGRRRRVRPVPLGALLDRRDGLRLVRLGGAAGFLGAVSSGATASCPASRVSVLGPSRSTSIHTSVEPTGTTSPTSAPRRAIVPATGDGSSTVALSVITSTTRLVLADHVADGHLPLDDFGLRHPFADVRQLEREVRHRTS